MSSSPGMSYLPSPAIHVTFISHIFQEHFFLHKAGFSGCQQQKLTFKRLHRNDMGKLTEFTEFDWAGPGRRGMRILEEVFLIPQVARMNGQSFQTASIKTDFLPSYSWAQGSNSWKKEREWPGLGYSSHTCSLATGL